MPRKKYRQDAPRVRPSDGHAIGRIQARYTVPDLALHTAPSTFEDRDAATSWLLAERRLIDDDRWTDQPVDNTPNGTYNETLARLNRIVELTIAAT